MLLFKNEIAEPYCLINLPESSNAIYVQWFCKCNLTQVKSATKGIFETLVSTQRTALLSDFTQCTGFEQVTNEFLNTDFYPKLSEYGIEKHAFIFSDDVYNCLMKSVFPKFYASMFEVEVFKSISKGSNWLQNMATKTAS